jgi:Zn-dependent protease with chaperone function
MVRGRYFDARHSAPVEATIEVVAADRWRLVAGQTSHSIDPSTVRISVRIGSIPRRIHFPGGAEFETTDNDGVDALSPAIRAEGWVHALEQRWGLVLASLALIAVGSVLFVRYGLPASADWTARHLPERYDRLIGRQSLQLLDRVAFEPSGLTPKRRAELEQLFARMTGDASDEHDYRLELRSSPRFGANALALPSGIIVMTDQLVTLSENDEELSAVLAHEIGHVRGRHALRQLIQVAGVSALAVAVLGDMGSVSALASSAPVLLTSKYSRDFEREADSFARAWLKDQGIAAERFDAILCRLGEKHGSGKESDFLSAHPLISERAHCAPGDAPAAAD